MSVCVVPFQVERGRWFAYIGIGGGTWAVTNWGNMACSCLCSCCHHQGQSCECIVGLILILSISVSVVWIGFGPYPRCVDCFVVGVVWRRVSVGEMSGCGNIGCVSCRGKQSTSSSLLLLSLSSSGRSFSILS